MSNNILLLAMGNTILTDDGAAILAAEEIEKEAQGVSIVKTSEAGLALLEFLEGYEKVLILDTIVSGKKKPGSIHRMNRNDFNKIIAPSPHYSGLPEVFELGERLEMDMPQEVVILAIEVIDPYTLGENVTPEIRNALSNYVSESKKILMDWSTSYA